MSKQRGMKGLAAGMALTVLACGNNFVSAEAGAKVVSDNVIPFEIVGSENSAEYTGAGTRYVWYVKEENEKTYRRLYNATYGKWVADWILCS